MLTATRPTSPLVTRNIHSNQLAARRGRDAEGDATAVTAPCGWNETTATPTNAVNAPTSRDVVRGSPSTGAASSTR